MLEALFTPSGLTPHGFCLLWQADLVTPMVIANGVIAVAYGLIPLQLALGIWRGGQGRIGTWLFVAFILCCGISHALDILTIYEPLYLLQAVWLGITATVSLATAALLPVLGRHSTQQNARR